MSSIATKEGKEPSKSNQTRMIMSCPSLSELPAPPRGKKGWPWTEQSSQLLGNMPGGGLWPKISIVTPSYNQAHFIEKAIRSILLQGYPNLEYIIMDGGSSDKSVEIIKKYDKWITYWISEPDKGQSYAINNGFKKASGKIFNWLNSDDYLMPNALSKVATAYQASPTAGAWCGGSRWVDINNNVQAIWWPNKLKSEQIAKWLQNHFAQSACFFSEEAWQKCGPLDENLYYAMDFDLWLKISKVFPIEKINEVLSSDHIHSEAKTQRSMAQMCAEVFLIQIRHGYEHLAIEQISQLIYEHVALMKRLGQISRFPLLRLFTPIVRIAWKKFLQI